MLLDLRIKWWRKILKKIPFIKRLIKPRLEDLFDIQINNAEKFGLSVDNIVAAEPQFSRRKKY